MRTNTNHPSTANLDARAVDAGRAHDPHQPDAPAREFAARTPAGASGWWGRPRSWVVGNRARTVPIRRKVMQKPLQNPQITDLEAALGWPELAYAKLSSGNDTRDQNTGMGLAVT